MKVGDIIERDGDTWLVLGIGHTNEEGKTYVHLASQTRHRKQRNGNVSVQFADWIDLETIETCKP